VEYSLGWSIGEPERAGIGALPDTAWSPALDADGGVREGADVAEITGLFDLGGWPVGMRVIVRRERPHPGAQLSLFEEADGWRYTAFVTNTAVGALQWLEARHRAHARVEDRIVLGGFLAHHGISGFLANIAEIRDIDEDEQRWRAFLSCWYTRHGSAPKTAADLRRDGEPNSFSHEVDSWDGQFITTHTGRLPNPLGLGRLLTGQVGRWRGDYVLRTGKHERGDRAVFWVERGET
jgi:hypothetical protein